MGTKIKIVSPRVQPHRLTFRLESPPIDDRFHSLLFVASKVSADFFLH